jgi:hypothetical protein
VLSLGDTLSLYGTTSLMILIKKVILLASTLSLASCGFMPVHPDQIDGVPVITDTRISCSYPERFSFHCVALLGANYWFDIPGGASGRLAISEDKKTVAIFGAPSAAEALFYSHPARAASAPNLQDAAANSARQALETALEKSGQKVMKIREVKQTFMQGNVGFIITFDREVLVDIEKSLPRRVTTYQR